MATYKRFVREHVTKDKTNITNTRIGDKEIGIFANKYHIPEDEYEDFLKLYNKHVIMTGGFEYLTEKQTDVPPILIDFDFRYHKDIDERQHDDCHISGIIETYTEMLIKYFDLPKNVELKIFVLEKPSVNTSNEDVTKDGIHMVFGIRLSHPEQLMLRDLVKDDLMKNVFNDLELTNTIDDVLDKGISAGHTNWQLFGSRKPGNDKYELKYYGYFKLDNDTEYELEFDTAPEENELSTFTILKDTSARMKHHPIGHVKEKYKSDLEPYTKPVKTSSSKKSKSSKYYNITNDMNSINEINEQCERYLSNMEELDPSVKTYYDMTMALPKNYSDDYHLWMNVGWALHNYCKDMFPIWVKFSSQSHKFRVEDIPTMNEKWCNMKDDGITISSICYWLKKENNELYQEIIHNSIQHKLNKMAFREIKEYDVAELLYEIYKDNFRCASLKHNEWYMYKGNRWVKNSKGVNLNLKISRTMSRLFNDKVDNLMEEIANCDDENKQEKLREQAKKFQKISIDCRSTNFKRNVMSEASTIFYDADPEFLNRLDTKTHIIGMSNGVIDFNEKIFRPGRPDDYISLTTGINYVEYNSMDSQHKRHRKIIQNDLLNKLFTNENLRRYAFDYFASILVGGNKSQTFNIFTGSGSNGKSLLIDFMSSVLGDYKKSIPLKAVTGGRQSVGGLSPEIAALKGVRFAVMSEPSKGDVLNDGIMKEMTGGDMITARALYSEPVTFQPQFKMAVCTNTLFDIKTDDDGTWRRIRKLDFSSKFKDPNKVDPNNPLEFPKDYDLYDKLKEAKEIFMSMLVDRAFETNGLVEDCVEVLEASKKYRVKQNVFLQFFDERIIETDEGELQKMEVYNEFKEWYASVISTSKPPNGSELFEFLETRIGPVGKSNKWIGYEINEDE
jgi:P4 family phage/plasmid primase-like protien